MLEVQNLYIACKENKNLQDHELFLAALQNIGVDVKDYPEHQMWILDYNQIEAIKNHPIVNECRGLLMGYDGSIIRKGFTRFYNLGENGVDRFDFEHSIAFEKADGSLMFVYFCKPTGRWEIGTRGTAFAEGPNEWHGTFRNFMLKAMGRTEEEFQEDMRLFDRDYTYLFEAVGPDNRIVTQYDKNQLVFLSCVENSTGNEVLIGSDPHDGDPSNWAFPKWNVRAIGQYRFNTQEDCLKALGELTGLQEGYVVYNTKTKMRVKIKSPTYLAAHRLRGNGLTVNAICELVVMNEYDEYLTVFPEDAPKFNDAIVELEKMLSYFALKYEANKHWVTQKEFALAVKDFELSAVMFKARANGTEFDHEFNQFSLNKRVDWLKGRLNNA